MYRNEILFMRKFLASLKKLNVQTLPFNNEYYQRGVSELHNYFMGHKEDFSGYVDDVSLLFLKRPIEGCYDEFSDVMLDLNGSLISFALKNPYYEKADITLGDDTAEFFLKDMQFNVSENCMMNCAEAFCEGAHIL